MPYRFGGLFDRPRPEGFPVVEGQFPPLPAPRPCPAPPPAGAPAPELLLDGPGIWVQVYSWQKRNFIRSLVSKVYVNFVECAEENAE